MSEEATLAAQPREVTGSGNAGRLRSAGVTPAVVYGQGEEADMIQINEHDVDQLLRTHGSGGLLVTLNVDSKPTTKVLLREVQYHPVNGRVLHVDFVKVDLTATTKVLVPITLVGDSAGVNEGGVLEQLIREVEVECLPTEIPSNIEVDVSELHIGDSINVGQLTVDADKVTVLTAADVAIVNVAAPRVKAAEEDEEGAEEGEGSAEPEVITEKKEDEEAGE